MIPCSKRRLVLLANNRKLRMELIKEMNMLPCLRSVFSIEKNKSTDRELARNIGCGQRSTEAANVSAAAATGGVGSYGVLSHNFNLV